jgi:ornithine cyclodeaminase/alanine dehydrogenase-like protein (mu-crystallin family)
VTLLLNRSSLERLLDPRQVIEVVQRGFADYASGNVQMPVRTSLILTDPRGAYRLMPCAMMDSNVLGTKIVWGYPGNPGRGLPTVGAMYVLADFETGFPLAVMDATYITGVRTAAASAVATRFLAREDARSVGIFGTGVQGELHAIALPLVRPIERILVWGSSPQKAAACAERLRRRVGVSVEPAESAAATAAADIVVAATTSRQPVFSGLDVRAGAHVNGVGSHAPADRELDSELVARSRVIVDTFGGAFTEAGDLLLPIEEGRLARESIVELGEVIGGRRPGRESASQITLFKSCGAAFEDAVTASLAYDLALAAGLGEHFDFQS